MSIQSRISRSARLGDKILRRLALAFAALALVVFPIAKLGEGLVQGLVAPLGWGGAGLAAALFLRCTFDPVLQKAVLSLNLERMGGSVSWTKHPPLLHKTEGIFGSRAGPWQLSLLRNLLFVECVVAFFTSGEADPDVLLYLVFSAFAAAVCLTMLEIKKSAHHRMTNASPIE